MGEQTAQEAGLRERKKQRTRETITEVAFELFDEQGFADTTIKQIADAAEISPRTVSAYFPVKEELVFARHEAVFDDLAERLTARAEGVPTADALRGWLVSMLEERRPDAERARRLRELVESDPALRTYERGVQERAEEIIAAAVAVDLDLPADELLPHMVGAATIAALDAIGRRAKEADAEGFEAQARALIDDAMGFIGAGVRGLAQANRSPVRRERL